MFPVGLSVAGSACVGNAMGEGNAQLAKSYAARILLYALFMGLFLAMFLNVFRHEVAEFFTIVPTLRAIIVNSSHVLSIAAAL